jgi:hypothetical protein
MSTNKIAKRCFISKPSDLMAANVMGEWQEVKVESNMLLKEIMDVYDKWSESPLIFVGDNYRYAYKIVSIEENEMFAILYQICVRFDRFLETYSTMNKRRVVIWFM